MKHLVNKNMQDLFENYNQQISDYKEFTKSKIWSQITSNSFKDIDSKKLSNFFSNNLSDGIDNSRLIDKEIVKKNFLILCDNYKKDEVLKMFVDENNNIGNSKTYYSYEKKIITYTDIFHINYYYEIIIYSNKNKLLVILNLNLNFYLAKSPVVINLNTHTY